MRAGRAHGAPHWSMPPARCGRPASPVRRVNLRPGISFTKSSSAPLLRRKVCGAHIERVHQALRVHRRAQVHQHAAQARRAPESLPRARPRSIAGRGSSSCAQHGVLAATAGASSRRPAIARPNRAPRRPSSGVRGSASCAGGPAPGGRCAAPGRTTRRSIRARETASAEGSRSSAKNRL